MTTDSPAAGTSETPAEILEHRLALVMNGGVSLAVWMGGVACEIDNVRRASNGIPLPDGATDEDKAVHALWVKATHDAGVRVTVDVIAGTSAGGLNGVLLAAAIARGASLAGLKKLWHDSGQMSAEALFRPQENGAQSLMNGDFFREQIIGKLKRMTTRATDGRDISLIVTSTALGPSNREVQDSAEIAFSEADHRRRFRFSRHSGRPCYCPGDGGYQLRDGQPVNELTDDETLAWAGRASASYPVAFAPVEETPILRERRVWPDWKTDGKLDWLADGGILDNSPFDPVLESIQRKTVDGPWKRTLCFIVPSGEEAALGGDIKSPENGAAGGQPAEPPPWTSVAAAAFSFPREANFRDDIDHLHETIRRGRSSFDVSRFQLLTGTGTSTGTVPGSQKLLAEARAICTQALPLYRQSCRAAAIYQVWDTIVRSRVNGYIDPVSEITDPGFHPGAHPWLPDIFPAAGGSLPTSWNWGADAADRVVRTMLRATSSEDGLVDLRKDLSKRLHEIAAISQAIDEYVVLSGKDLASLHDPMLTEVLDEAYRKLGAEAALASIVAGAAAAYADGRLDTGDRAPDVLCAALAVEVSNGAGSLPDDRPRPIFDFARFGLDKPPGLLQDAYERALPSHSVTPIDPSKILYGTRLNHFAAFADPDWRDWDWMWGRMNALERMAQLLNLDDADVDKLTTAILAAENCKLKDVEAGIEKVVSLSGPQMWNQLRSADRFPPALDALFDFLRAQGPGGAKLQEELQHLGQVASDLLARSGHQGHVRHHVLRDVALIPRKLLWRHAKPSR